MFLLCPTVSVLFKYGLSLPSSCHQPRKYAGHSVIEITSRLFLFFQTILLFRSIKPCLILEKNRGKRWRVGGTEDLLISSYLSLSSSIPTPASHQGAENTSIKSYWPDCNVWAHFLLISLNVLKEGQMCRYLQMMEK